jgi:hypothetical protein
MVPVMLVFLRSVVVAAAVLALSGCASALQQIANNLAPEIFDTPEYEADESEYERSEAALTSPAASAPASDAASRFSQRVYKWGTTYDDYPLDSTERRECLEAVMVTYEGETLPYSGPVRAHPLFVERLRAFEKVVEEVAVEVYGRVPTRLVHMGSFSCRPSASGSLSEHALGNALDLAGVDFAADPSAEGPAAGAFQVRVIDHWFATDGFELEHRRFLHLLTDRLFDHPEIFRRIIGPPTRLHDDHLHLDVGFSRHANFQFEEDQVGVPPERRATALDFSTPR